ncbi:hypothetical protein [Pseudovibrio sp. SCP19]|uniref:hypothetical protein n=1 Tax=Pseudovibrio sp. SCP19 TaxID=3141374 RepID=UPI00333B94A3
MTATVVEIDVSEHSRKSVQLVEIAIKKKVSEMGGVCEEFREFPRLEKCYIPGETFGVSYGFRRVDKDNPDRNFFIFINSNYVHLFPPSKADVVQGRYVLEEHKSFEAWFLDSIPADIIVKKVREYLGYETKIPL